MLAVLALAGCGASTQPVESDFVDGYARLVAVTVLDSTTTSGLVPITIHWLPRCSERLDRVVVTHEPGYQTLVALHTRLLLDAHCPASSEGCVCRDTTLDVPLEARLVLLNDGGAVELDSAQAGPSVSGGQHALRVIKRGSLLPVAGVVIEHRSELSPGLLLGSATTDSTGWAIAAPGCSESPDGSTFVLADDPESFGCMGVDILRFDAAKAPCRRALRTFLLHGPTPPTPD
jgi:hypothetical protein